MTSLAHSSFATADLPRVPIVLGVAGHVDPRPEDVPALKEAVKKILQKFHAQYPDTPLVLMTSLARGADQLAAGVALEFGLRIVAPLPFPIPVYADSSSFKDDLPARERFLNWVSDLESRARIESFVVPCSNRPLPDDIPTWERFRDNDDERHACYTNASGYIVRHCHALIAFWDRQFPLKPSGTAETVVWKLSGRPPKHYPDRRPLLQAGETGPVFVIHTPRVQPVANDSAQTAAGTTSVLVPNRIPQGAFDPFSLEISDLDNQWVVHSHIQERAYHFCGRVCEALNLRPHPKNLAAERLAEFRQFHETCHTIDEFNRDARHHRELIDERLARLPGSELGEIPAGMAIPAPVPQLLRLRGAAAVMSGYLDKWHNRFQMAMFLCLFMAVVSFHVYAHVFTIHDGHGVHQPRWLSAFVLLLLMGALLVCWVWWQRLTERRHDYRALAEALRVRIYWGLAGLRNSVADSYLSQLRSEMAWTRRALQSASPPPAHWQQHFEAQAKVIQLEQLKLVEARWVERQRDFYERKFHDHHRSAARCRGAGFALAVGGWLLAAGLMLIPSAFSNHDSSDSSQSHAEISLADNRDEPADALHVANANDASRSPSSPALDASHPNHWLLFGSGIFVLAGGLLVAFCERQSHEELARQYERMWVVFSHGSAELREHLAIEDIAFAQRVLETLGHEAIAEHAQWLILRRNRPFELLIH